MSSGSVVDFATLTVSSTAVDLSDASPAYNAGHTVTGFFATVEDANVRWRADGTAPTTTEGHVLYEGQTLEFVGRNYTDIVENIQFIRDDSTDAKLKITYFGL